jgi:hypothetical protein
VSTGPHIPWPLNIKDPVRAIHFHVEPGCMHREPSACPTEKTVHRILDALAERQQARAVGLGEPVTCSRPDCPRGEWEGKAIARGWRKPAGEWTCPYCVNEEKKK